MGSEKKFTVSYPHDRLLKFSTGNAKLDTNVHTFSVASGYSCPGAKECLAKVNKTTFKLEEGPDAKFRCFSAVLEAARPSVFKARQHNFNSLLKCKSAEEMRDLILQSLPPNAVKVRVHVGGDFFNQNYFDAWQLVAQAREHVEFYAYTKSIPFWLSWLKRYKKLAENFSLVASRGGKFDDLITPQMCDVLVVMHPSEARKAKRPIDHTDIHAMKANKPFALLIHGQQPAGSKASEAIKRLKSEGIQYSYGKTHPTKTKAHKK